MNALEQLRDVDMVYRMGWTLVHSLWLGAAVAAMLAVTLAVLRRRSPQARYLAACFAMILMAAAPLATFPLVSAPAPETPIAAARATIAVPALPAVTLPDMPALPLPPAATMPAAAPIAAAEGQGNGGIAAAAVQLSHALEPALPWMTLAWLCGVLALSLWRLAGWMCAQRLRRLAVPPSNPALTERLKSLARALRVSRPVRLLESTLVRVPVVIGWLRPVILLPAGLVTGLAADEIEAVLAHELAHIRRLDYLLNLVQAVIEVLLFYHPAVWWIGRRMRAERERCCDDVAVGILGNPVRYVEALAAVATLGLPPSCSRESRAAVVALGTSGRDLMGRVRRLLGLPDPACSSVAASATALLLLVAMLAVSITVGISCGGSGARSDALDAKDADNAAWCPLVNGLQAGTTLSHPHYPYRPGEALTFNIYLSNCKDQPLTLTFPEAEAWVPLVYKERGDLVGRKADGLKTDPAPAERTVTVAASGKVLVGTVQLKLDATPTDKPAGPHIYLEPGQYYVNWAGHVKESGLADAFEISTRAPELMVARPEVAGLVRPVAPPDARHPPSVAIYMVVRSPEAPDVEKASLADLKLEAEPLLSDKDIVAYYWNDHIIQLTPEAFKTLQETRGLLMSPGTRFFVVMANGQRCYLGAFDSLLASYIPKVPIARIWTDRQHASPENAIRIGPLGMWDPNQPGPPDVRSDPRVREALAAFGKLRSNGATESPSGERIASVVVRGNVRVPTGRILTRMRLREGSFYTPAAADEDLKIVHALGEFENIVIRPQREATGLVLVVEVTERPILDRLEVAPAIQKERDDLLAQADQKLRQGLRDLAKQFPQLATANNKPLEEALKEAGGKPETLSVSFGRGNRPQMTASWLPEPIADAKTWSLIAIIRPGRPLPAGETVAQLGMMAFCPHLNLEGQWRAVAFDPKLNTALRKLLDDALAPLKALDAEVAKTPAAAPGAAAPKPVAGKEMVLSAHNGKVRVVVDGLEMSSQEITWQGRGAFSLTGNGQTFTDTIEAVGDQVKLTVTPPGSTLQAEQIVVNLQTGDMATHGAGVLRASANPAEPAKPPAPAPAAESATGSNKMDAAIADTKIGILTRLMAQRVELQLALAEAQEETGPTSAATKKLEAQYNALRDVLNSQQREVDLAAQKSGKNLDAIMVDTQIDILTKLVVRKADLQLALVEKRGELGPNSAEVKKLETQYRILQQLMADQQKVVRATQESAKSRDKPAAGEDKNLRGAAPAPKPPETKPATPAKMESR